MVFKQLHASPFRIKLMHYADTDDALAVKSAERHFVNKLIIPVFILPSYIATYADAIIRELPHYN